MVCQRQAAGTGDHGMNGEFTQLFLRLFQKAAQSFLNIGKMPLIVCK